MYQVLILPDAEIDIIEITEWYAPRSLTSLSKWLAEFDSIREVLSSNPFQYQEYYLFTRRAVFRLFPYNVIYAVDGINMEVEIIMVCHQSQDPNRLTRRLNL